MSKAHYIAPQATLVEDGITVRLGASGGKFTTLDQGKFVKLSAESMYDLCAAGDPLEAIVLAVATASSANQSIGTIIDDAILYVLADGAQATPGTGTLAVGDFVVCGTVTAKGTAISGALPKVCKATVQPNGSDPATTAGAGTAIKNAMWAWRVESLGTAGTGAVGTQIAIRRVNG